MTDKASLWDKLRSELEAEANSTYADFMAFDKNHERPVKWHGDALKAAAARDTLDRMLQMETLS